MSKPASDSETIRDAEAQLAAIVTPADVIEIGNSVSEAGLSLDATIFRFAALFFAAATRRQPR